MKKKREKLMLSIFVTNPLHFVSFFYSLQIPHSLTINKGAKMLPFCALCNRTYNVLVLEWVKLLGELQEGEKRQLSRNNSGKAEL